MEMKMKMANEFESQVRECQNSFGRWSNRNDIKRIELKINRCILLMPNEFTMNSQRTYLFTMRTMRTMPVPEVD